MGRLINYSWIAILIVVTSCFEKDVFPDTPRIEFEEIKFVDLDNAADSLILTFSFEDGTGDIGLGNGPDLLSPFQVYDLIIDDEDSTITINQAPSTIQFPLHRAPVLIDEQNGEIAYFFFPESKTFFSSEDNRPAYGCDFYEIIEEDTFYVARNEFHFNFHIEFQRKIGENYEPINFRETFNSTNCSLGNFNGRIPVFDPDGKSGTINYAMLSQAFRLAFIDDIIRAKFFIYDRAQNKSNEAFTSDFILSEITQ